jgi:hypothetical protein
MQDDTGSCDQVRIVVSSVKPSRLAICGERHPRFTRIRKPEVPPPLRPRLPRQDKSHTRERPTRVTPVLFVDGRESRALRDATRVILSLAGLAHLCVPEAVLSRVSERFGVRYGVCHVDSAIFPSLEFMRTEE